MPQKKEAVQWTHKGKNTFDIPPLAIGFVYRIDLEDGRYYIGKKNLTSTRGRGKKAVTKESNWKTYCSSSKELKEIIKNGNINYKKEILEFCFSKAELTYRETASIICLGALIDDKSLNGWVKATIFKRFLLK